MATHETFLDINGTRIHYTVYGKGEPTLIFVHAGIADSRMWDEQTEKFSSTNRVITYDMRGYGFSPLVAGEYSHHADLIALMDALTVDRCVLIGCSKGGGIVLDTTLADPDRVAGVVVVGGIAHGLEIENMSAFEDPPQWEEAVKAFKEGDLEKSNELEVQMWVDGYNQPVGRADTIIREKVRQMNAIALHNEANALDTTSTILEPKAGTRLNDLQVPVLFITGELDEPIIQVAADQMLTQITHGEHIKMTGVAHLPNMEAPDDFNQTLSNFIQKL